MKKTNKPHIQQEGDGMYVGIDPNADGDGHGFAWLLVRHGKILQAEACKMTLPEAVETLRSLHRDGALLGVYIEAGWLNSGNWHTTPGMSRAKIAAIGCSLGANQQSGKDIGQCLEYHGVPFRYNPPLIKYWKGRDRKITHEELRDIVAVQGLKLRRMSQDERDALLLVWVLSGQKVIIRPR